MRGKISVLMALLLLLCSVFAMPVQAETVMQDGIEVTLKTDKESYDALETICAELTVKNANRFDVTNVTMKITPPANYQLLGDAQQKIDTLAMGEEQVLQVMMHDASAAASVLPNTGDASHSALWSMLLVAAVAVLCVLVIRNPQAKRVISLFLCVAIVGPMVMQAVPAQAEEAVVEIVVSETVSVDGKPVTLTGTVTHDVVLRGFALRRSVAIVTQPESKTVSAGELATFTVEAVGDGLKYQWYYRNKGTSTWKKASSTTASYSIRNSEERNGRQFRCKITDKYGNVEYTDVVTMKLPAVKITTQPKDVIASVGEKAKFTVKATGDGLKYQWYYRKNSSSSWSKANSTKSSYSPTMKESYNNREVRCKVTDAYGKSVYSDAATMKLPTVEITTHPKDVTASVGEKAKFTVKATGDGLKYQWYYRKNSSSSWSKANSTKSSYSPTMKESYNNRQVRCKVTDAYGKSVYSEAATMRLPAVEIITHPQDAWAYDGEKATISVKATGDGLKYQWYYSTDGGKTYKTASGTKASYSLTMNEERDNRKMYCEVSDAYGNSVKSNEVTLDTRFKATITEQPKNASAVDGSKATTTIAATGDGLSYQWYYKDPGMSAFKKSSIVSAVCAVTMKAERDGRQMYCIVTDAYGNTAKSDTITLTVMKFSYTAENGKVTITKYLGTESSVVVPDTIDGYPVAAIGNDAFAGNTTLKQITLPDSIETIGQRAFKGCTGLSSMDTY